MKDTMTECEAAEYLGLTTTYLNSLRRTKAGPKYLKPSARTIVYSRGDLDAWRSNWKQVGAEAEEVDQ